MYAVAEFRDPVGQDGDAALAGRPVAGRQVVQHLRQLMLLQLLGELRLAEIVGKEVFDAAKAGGLCRSKAVDERHLAEQHGEIGGKSGHSQKPLITAMIDGQAG